MFFLVVADNFAPIVTVTEHLAGAVKKPGEWLRNEFWKLFKSARSNALHGNVIFIGVVIVWAAQAPEKAKCDDTTTDYILITSERVVAEFVTVTMTSPCLQIVRTDF